MLYIQNRCIPCPLNIYLNYRPPNFTLDKLKFLAARVYDNVYTLESLYKTKKGKLLKVNLLQSGQLVLSLTGRLEPVTL